MLHLFGPQRIEQPAFNALFVIVGLLYTVLTASISYRFFEAPILRYKRRFEFIRSRSI